jgi:hypothetical protein
MPGPRTSAINRGRSIAAAVCGNTESIPVKQLQTFAYRISVEFPGVSK